MSLPGVVIVDDGTDALAIETTRALRATGIAAKWVAAGDLARVPLRLTTRSAQIDGCHVGVVVFRAEWRSCFAQGFEEADEDFCSAETQAAWLSLLDLGSVLAINKSDPELWFSDMEWPVWRRRLEDAGVPVTPLEVGEATAGDNCHWLLWGGGVAGQPGPRAARCLAAALTSQRLGDASLWLQGRRIDGAKARTAEAAAAVLASHGAALAEVALAADDSVLSCTCRPVIRSDRALGAAVRGILKAVDDHLRHR